MTFLSKVQPAGGCFALQTLYGACRVFVLKSSKSQDILVKIGCFTQNGDLSNTHTPTPALRTYTNSSLASCILVQLSDLCNLGFAVHVQYGITNTCWRHAHYGEVCRGASHLPNCLIYIKVPQIAVFEQSKSEKLGILCIFGQRNSLKFRKGSSFVRFAPSEAKKNPPEFLHFWKICTLLTQKSLVWAWLKPVKCIGLGSKGGLGSWAPSIFWGWLEYPLAPPKNPISLKI